MWATKTSWLSPDEFDNHHHRHLFFAQENRTVDMSLETPWCVGLCVGRLCENECHTVVSVTQAEASAATVVVPLHVASCFLKYNQQYQKR